MIYDVITRWDSAYKMLTRALYLRKAVDHFVDEDDDLVFLKLTKKKWDQAAAIVTILLSFKMTSQRLQAIKRPAIDSVFWNYETLFNKIDVIKETFNKSEYIDEKWAQELHAEVEKLSQKLKKYYNKTAMSFVYSDSCILESRSKLVLFQQEQFDDDERNWAQHYKKNCRDRYIQEYELIEISNLNSRKRQYEKSDENDSDDYRFFLHKQNHASVVINEFDNYMTFSSSDEKINTLDYW